MSAPDWYAILGIGRGASQAQVARAFRRAAFRWHPDRNADRTELAHSQFLLVQRAYETLSDRDKRRAFDLESAPPPPTPPPQSFQQPASAPRRPTPKSRYEASPPPSHHPIASALSFLAWIPLWLAIKLVGFVLLILLGGLAEKSSRAELSRRAPVFTGVVIPLGRTLLVAGIVLLAITKIWLPLATPRFSIVLLIGGGLVFALERVAHATVWALGKGRNPKS